jgi:hypothetical protein
MTASRRGYALPLVLLLALVASVVMAMVLDRQRTQTLSQKRQLDHYRDDHFAKGMQEAIDAWMKSVAARPLAELLDTDGHALDMELAGGVTLRLYAFDGQGGILSEIMGLTGEARTDAANLIDALAQLPPELRVQVGGFERGRLPEMTRRFGPLQISVNSAPEPVLHAVMRYALDGSSSADAVKQIVEARSGKVLAAADLSDAIAKIKADIPQRSIINRLLTAQPVLYRLEARLFRTGASADARPAAVYAGYTLISGRSTQRDRTSSQTTRLTSIFDWHRQPDPREAADWPGDR